MEIEPLLNNGVKKESNIFSNIVSQFMELLKERLKTNDLKDKLKNQYAQILKNDKTIEYSVFSKVAGKDYTILLFQNEGENIIKIPNLLLPKETNSRTVLNYKNGEFEINQEKTKINNENWKKKQNTEEVLKENRIYFVDVHRRDYTEVIAIDNGKTYQFNFMQDYIGSRLKIDVNEGEYVVAKDGKFEKYEENVKISDKKIEEKIKNREQEIENDKLSRKQNLKEGSEFVVKRRINDREFVVENMKTNKETYMGLYTNKNELEELQIEGVEDIYCYKTNNATIDNLREGDILVTKNSRIIKEETENFLEDNKLTVNQYKGKSGEIYIVNKVEEAWISITDMENSKNLIVKKEECINIEEGDFIKTKNIGYEKYNGVIQIENQKSKDNIATLYNYIL